MYFEKNGIKTRNNIYKSRKSYSLKGRKRIKPGGSRANEAELHLKNSYYHNVLNLNIVISFIMLLDKQKISKLSF